MASGSAKQGAHKKITMKNPEKPDNSKLSREERLAAKLRENHRRKAEPRHAGHPQPDGRSQA
jgi:hypothetical protein